MRRDRREVLTFLSALLLFGCAPAWTRTLNDAAEALQAGRPRDALHIYGRLVVEMPTSPEGHYGRGLAFRELKQPQDAIDAFRDALRVDPKFRYAILALAQTLEEQGDIQGALATLSAGSERLPNDKAIQNELTRVRANR